MNEFEAELRLARIPTDATPPLVQIGRRFNHLTGSTWWVVCVAAANRWAFELPIELTWTEVAAAAQSIIEWDCAMAPCPGVLMNDTVVSQAMWLAMLMPECPLKATIDSAHPPIVCAAAALGA